MESGTVGTGVMNHSSLSGRLMDDPGFGGCQENTTYLHSANRKIWWWRDKGLGLFLRAPSLNSSER